MRPVNGRVVTAFLGDVHDFWSVNNQLRESLKQIFNSVFLAGGIRCSWSIVNAMAKISNRKWLNGNFVPR